MPESQPDIDRLQRMIQKEIKPLLSRIDHLTVLMTGNGTPDKGMIVRVDRIEQNQIREANKQRRSLAIWMAWIGAGATIVSTCIAVCASLIFG